ncbi:MAG: efflux RND transporter periplasmic adaptor subunit [Cyclobacteriaceae bacterium]|nr:efflux RND transporter periplasmic adaptor subunit [Cytophagales bacterium]HNP76922.1 efflux RND transporter periplasmic adaptor subunit [Cyclobacteriaceae bacterium]
MKNTFYLNTVLIIVMGVAVASCAGDDKAKLAELKKKQAELNDKIKELEQKVALTDTSSVKLKSKEVAVLELKPHSFDYYVQTQGSVEAIDNILISAKTMGVLTQVFAREGDVVTKGQTLAQIDNSVIVRSIEELKSSISLANTVYERQKNLWDQKIGTEVQFLQAKNNKESLEKRLATLNEQLDMTRIKSPISGSVDEVAVKIGQAVSPGQPAFRVVSFDRLKMKANVSEAYVSNIQKGNSVKLVFSDINKEMTARITFVGKTINALSRTFPVEVELPSQATYLRPNMSGVLKVIYTNVPDALTVPVNLVQDINGQKVVYIAEADGKKMVARKRVVTVAGVFDSQAHVTGLKAGDKVITVGYQGLNEGELVKI